MSDDLPWHKIERANDPDAIEAQLDATVRSILAGPVDERAKRIIADAHRRALQRRQFPCVEGREQAMLIVAAGIKATERLFDGDGKP